MKGASVVLALAGLLASAPVLATASATVLNTGSDLPETVPLQVVPSFFVMPEPNVDLDAAIGVRFFF